MKFSLSFISIYFALSEAVIPSHRQYRHGKKKSPFKLKNLKTSPRPGRKRALTEALSDVQGKDSSKYNLRNLVVELSPYVVLPEGIWTDSIYGDVFLSDENGTFAWIQETSISCIVEEEGLDLETLYFEEYLPLTTELQANDTVLYQEQGINKYVAVKTDGFVSGCAEGITPFVSDEGYERDPGFALDVLVENLAAHYAFFETSYPGGYDAWVALANNSTLDENTTDEELFDAIIELVEPLGRGIFLLSDEDGYFTPTPWYASVEEEYSGSSFFDSAYLLAQEWFDIIIDAFYGGEATEEIIEEFLFDSDVYWLDQIVIWAGFLNSTYLCGTMDGLPVFPFIYGMMMEDDGTSCAAGYFGFGDFEPPDVDEARSVLDMAMTNMIASGCGALIIDVRINEGGWDEIGLMVASYLVEEPTYVFSKRAFFRNTTDGTVTYSETNDVFVDPAGLYFDGPVVVLSSESTAGAGEVFVLAVKDIPSVTVMGQRTFGLLSDNLFKYLPNGWELAFSNEEYSKNGTIYEIIGVPPDVVLSQQDPLPLDFVQIGKDTWFEEALMFLNISIPVPTSDPGLTTNDTDPIMNDTDATEPPTNATIEDKDSGTMSGACLLQVILFVTIMMSLIPAV
eukprot:scaffold46464_cov199-Amphora_coffeaeformis.AAC.4